MERLSGANKSQDRVSPLTNEPSLSLESFLSNGSQISYHEMSETPILEKHPLIALQENVLLLSEMTHKLQFMNREIRYLLKI